MGARMLRSASYKPLETANPRFAKRLLVTDVLPRGKITTWRVPRVVVSRNGCPILCRRTPFARASSPNVALAVAVAATGSLRHRERARRRSRRRARAPRRGASRRPGRVRDGRAPRARRDARGASRPRGAVREQRRVRGRARVGGVPGRAVRTRERHLAGGDRLGARGHRGARGAEVGDVSGGGAARVGGGDATDTRRTQAVVVRAGVHRVVERDDGVLSVVRDGEGRRAVRRRLAICDDAVITNYRQYLPAVRRDCTFVHSRIIQ